MTPSDVDVVIMGYYDRKRMDAHFTACVMTTNLHGKVVTADDIFDHPGSFSTKEKKLDQFSEEGKKAIEKKIKESF